MHPVLMTLNAHQLGLAVDGCLDRGYGIQPGALFPETAGLLASWAQAQAMNPNTDLGVYQHFSYVKYADGAWPDEISWLVAETERVVLARAHDRARVGLQRWRVNDVAVQCYDSGEAGIGLHRDFAADKHLVVVYTVQGLGLVEVIDEKGRLHRHYACQRTVMCLAGPDPISGADPRLAHTVGPPLTVEPRISIALRMSVIGE